MRLSSKELTIGERAFSKACSRVLMVREMVGWEMLNSSARSSSVQFWRRVRRVVLRAWFRLRVRGLVSGLFQVVCLFRAVACVVNCLG